MRPQFALLLLSILSAPSVRAQSLSDSSRVSLLTISPGLELYSAWGHTAIRVTDPEQALDVTFNYGTFDFEQPNFYLKFLRGRLDYQLSAASFETLVRYYESVGRPIIEQKLRLSPDQRRAVFDFLRTNYLPENRSYRYEFFFDNCSTRPRDVIERAIGRQIAAASPVPDSPSFRTLVVDRLSNRAWTRLGVNLLIGSTTDRSASPRETLFLPLELAAALDTVQVQQERLPLPLVESRDTLFWVPGAGHPAQSAPWPAAAFWVILLVGGAMTIVPGQERRTVVLRRLDAVVFGLAGVVGLVIAALWFGTEHTSTVNNLNLAWAWPTHLAGWALTKTRSKSARLYWTTTVFACAIVLIGWAFWPQTLPDAMIPFVLLLGIRAADRARRPSSEGSR